MRFSVVTIVVFASGTLRSMSKEEFVQQLQEWGVEFEIVEPLK